MRRTWGRTMWVGVVVGGMIVAHAEAAVVICERKGKLKLRQDACTEKETQVDASELGVAGPQGPAGTDGAQGPEGPLGPQGVPGLSGVEVVTANGNVIINFSGVSSATALCPGGKSVIGGGVGMGFLFGSINSQSVRESYPVTTMGQGWFGALEANVTDDWGARVYAVCANTTP